MSKNLDPKIITHQTKKINYHFNLCDVDRVLESKEDPMKLSLTLDKYLKPQLCTTRACSPIFESRGAKARLKDLSIVGVIPKEELPGRSPQIQLLV